jgi:mannosyltransferase
MTTVSARGQRASLPPAPRPRVRPLGVRGATVLVGVFAAAVSFAGSWNPSFWGDEAASIMSAERPLPSLFAMLRTVDAVHGLYYLFLHGWIQLFGASELSTRLPSAIGGGLAASGTVVLGRMLFDARIGLIAGLVFAALPRVTYMGAEARSYALATALGVWLTVFFIRLLRRRVVAPLPWLLYSLGFALAIYSFLYLVFLGLIHAVVLLGFHRDRALVRRWFGAVCLALVIASPVVVFDLAERHQVAFLGSRPKFSPALVFVTQWFGNPWLAALCWAVIALAVAAGVHAWRGSGGLPLPRAAGTALVAAWVVLPTLLLELGNAAVAPMYTTRYLSFCTPAVALALAIGITALGRNWMRVAAVALLFGLATPSYLAQRGPYAKDAGSDWRQLSAVVGERAHPGDAIVFDRAVKPSRRPRSALHLYPSDYAGLLDVGLVTRYSDTSGLWDVTAPVSALDAPLKSARTVWAVELTPTDDREPLDVTDLERIGFRVASELPVHRSTVYELTRETS